MDFLDNLVIPQSEHHLMLLRYILVMTMMLLIPYFSAVIGSTILSLFYQVKGKSSNDTNKLLLSQKIIDLVTFNKSIVFSLGIVPFLSAVFCYAQLLNNSQSGVTLLLFLSFIFFVAGLTSVYTYKYSFQLSEIFKSIKGNSKFDLLEDKAKDDVIIFDEKSSGVLVKSGKYGLVLLVISSYLFIAATSLAFNSNAWGSDSSVIFNLINFDTIIGFLLFISLSIAASSALLLYDLHKNHKKSQGGQNEFYTFAARFSKHTSIISMILVPGFLVLRVFVTPVNSLNFNFFVLLVFALIISFVLIHITYSMIKNNCVRHAHIYLFLTILLFGLIIINDNNKLDRSGKAQFAELASNYEDYKEEIMGKYGLVSSAISGADIYNGRCIACHNFDKKIVGPPYNSVLPRYDGKMDELVKFILNPVKVNPEYTTMPNQGLKPNEAKAVAEYIMNTYKSNQK